MAQHADRIINNRRERTEFRRLLSLIIFHGAPADTEPRTAAGFVCRSCRHSFELCTCFGYQNRQEAAQ